MQLLNLFLFWIFFGFLCAYLAPKKGRNPKNWFIIGLFMGLLGVLLLLLLPSTDRKREEFIQKQRGAPAQQPQPIPLSARLNEITAKIWYYLDAAHKQQGPVDFPFLSRQWNQKMFSNNTYVWADGMEQWKKIGELPELQNELRKK